MTKIEWTRNADGSQGKSWNPIRARRKSDGKQGHYCQRVSPGCKHCYAAAMNVWRGNGVDYTVPALDQAELYLDQDVLAEPLHWRKPQNVFVCSMTDLFADFVQEEWIAQIYAIEAATARHTYMHLTKRPENRLRFLRRCCDAKQWADYLAAPCDEYTWSEEFECLIANAINGVLAPEYNVGWPLRNVREGVSVEDQKAADERIPLLLNTPAALRFISAEPLLAPVGLARHFPHAHGMRNDKFWVICGGESGSQARPCDPEWLYSIVQQCRAAGVPVFVKQLGSCHPSPGDSKGGDMVFWPEHLRVREYPQNPRVR